ncbi:tetratricopeptide repeat protein [Chitinophaga sp. sic0106]|uniref:tetratricopeptide repeat protein n=1 Tax=Chitinophaga sp. sic0106 TaxID=2854785 RepID=UPI001C4562C1|nr:tetratricopeptide repeat protein [Chitinophaga sp. sic0106]MBV7529147.1 tetratricopeptide repeat protein [Chitinophaga sp. sic0106]
MYRFCQLITIILLSVISFANAQTKQEPAITAAIALGRQFPDSAFQLLRTLQDAAANNKDQLTSAICLQQMGKLCMDQGYYSKALEYYQQAETLLAASNNRRLHAANLNDMGLLYFHNINKAAAKQLHLRALELYRKAADTAGVAATYGYIGHLFEKNQQHDSAYAYQQLALKAYESIRDNYGIAGIYENLGSICEDQEEYDSALVLFQKALAIYEANNDKTGSIEVVNNIGDVYRKTNRFRQGMTYSLQALDLAKATNNNYQQAAACKDIAQTYHLLHHNDSAYLFMEQSRKSLLNIYSDQSNRQMNFLRIMYDVNKKNDEILRLEGSHRMNVIIYCALGAVVLLLGVVGLLVISRQKLRISEQKAISEKNEQLHLAQKDQLELNSKKLANHTLQLIQRTQFMDELKESISGIVKEEKRDNKKQLQQLLHKIEQNQHHDKQWEEFNSIFGQVHQAFFDKLNALHTDLTPNDIKLVALHKMNINSKDMATILGISQDSLRVARYRVRKKLNLPEGDSLNTFAQQM